MRNPNSATADSARAFSLCLALTFTLSCATTPGVFDTLGHSHGRQRHYRLQRNSYVEERFGLACSCPVKSLSLENRDVHRGLENSLGNIGPQDPRPEI